MNRALARSLMAFLCLAVLPAAAYAQASFSGIVKDTSGAVSYTHLTLPTILRV